MVTTTNLPSSSTTIDESPNLSSQSSLQYRYKSKSNQPGIQNESFPIKVRVTAWRNGVLGSLPAAGQPHLGLDWNPRLGAIQRTSDNYTSQRSVNFNNLINIKINTNPTIGKSSVPSFLLSNVCHITNKVDELSAVVSIYDPSVVMITESWLSDDIGDSSVKIGNKYNIFRRDRKSPGGGVIAYVNNCLPAERMTHLEEENKEVIWLLLKPPRTPRPYSTIVAAVVYYPPGQSAEQAIDMNEYLTTCIDSLLRERPSSGIVIAGDFNQLKLRELCNRFNLKRSVTKPTRGHNILDQILTNILPLFDTVSHLPPIGRSDHQCLLIKPIKRQKTPVTSKKIRLMKRANLNDLSLNMASEDWTTVYSALDVDEKVSAYNSIIIRMLDEFLPEKTIRVHHSDKPWITGNIKMQIKARQKAFSRGDQPRYKQLCEKVANLIAKAKATYYRSKASEFRTSNQSKWYNCIYSLVNAENTTHTQFPHKPENLDLSDLAEKLQKAFTKPWSDRYTNVAFEIPEVNHPQKNNKPPLPSIGQVKAVLKHLNPRKATGIDKVPAWMLKQYHEDLAPVVYDIVCCSISQCCYPSLYKHALISPVPKVQPPRDINNDFRQISVLPHLAKILEKIQLQLNIEDLKIKNNQHAFTQHRSTVSALISTTQTWFNATDCSKTGKMGVHAAFIDFRKAFDLVDHNILLNKLAAMNINKPFWLWIKSFLSGRVQQVNLNGTLSSIATCPAGVPQGSVISPILFNTYIDDLEDALPEQLKVSTNKYADDCTQHQIVSVDSNSNLQQSINEVNNWAVLNKMAINAKKTKDMWISFTDAIPEPPRLRIGNELIERVNAFKLLGVSFQNNLKWNAHVEEITRKANKRLYHLRECRKSQLPAEVGIITYQSKIRPILEYASPVWAGLPNYLRDEIERVQSRSLRILGLEKDFLPPLNERREEATSREVDRFMNDPNHPCRSVLPKLINNQYNLRNIDRNRNISFFSGTERHKHSFSGRACKYV